MVNNPHSVPPAGSPQDPQSAQNQPKAKANGTFQFSTEHKFAGMTFTAKEWTKLMNIFLKNLSSFINKTYQKATEKMKKDWRRGEGKDDD